jgi:biotin carboxyl carrier protein
LPEITLRVKLNNKKGNQELAQEKVEFPITGKITSVNVKVGDAVKEGDTLCLIESMKMENPILAPVAGTITEINISVGELVETGNLVAIIEY